MKKLFVCVCALSLLAACYKSPAQKAEALIHSEKSKTIAKTTTLEVKEIKVDSAFSPTDDPTFFKQMEEASKLNDEYYAKQKAVMELRDSMNVLLRQNSPEQLYKELKRQEVKLLVEIDQLKERGNEIYDQLIAIASSEPKFIGYKAMYTFQIHNEAGSTLPATEFYLFDTDVHHIVYSCSNSYYEEAQEGIQNLLIAKAIKEDREESRNK